eukprot:jgi/Bigna1/131489/aug1.14_g6197
MLCYAIVNDHVFGECADGCVINHVQVFEVPFSLDLPGMLKTRHSLELRDWFLMQKKSTSKFTLTTESRIRVHVIPGDPRDKLKVRLVDNTPGSAEVVVTESFLVGTPLLSHETVLRALVPSGSYRIEVLFGGGDPGDSKQADCKRFHFQVSIAPSSRDFDSVPPYKCPSRTTTPVVNTQGLRETDGGVVIVGKRGLQFSSEGGKLATTEFRGPIDPNNHEAKEVWGFDFTTERLMHMIPYIDATLDSNFLTGHMRLVIHRLDVPSTSDDYLLSEADGYSASEVAAAARMARTMAASAQVFVANNDADENHAALDLVAGAVYRLSIYQVLPKTAERCLFYDLSFAIDFVDLRMDEDGGTTPSFWRGENSQEAQRERFENGFVDDSCTLATLPMTFNIPGYLGYSGHSMHIHEVYRFNPNMQLHTVEFKVLNPSLFRIYIPFHQTQLTVHVSVMKHDKGGRSSFSNRRGEDHKGPVVAQGSNAVNDDVSAELQPGRYLLLFQFSHADSLVRSPGSMRCVGFVSEIAIMPLSLLGAGRHWCGPSELEEEYIPNKITSSGLPPADRGYVMVAGGLTEKRVRFTVEKEKMRVKLSVDSDFVTGHVGVLLQEASGSSGDRSASSSASTRSRSRHARRRGPSEAREEGESGKGGGTATKIVIPAHQIAPNHAVLDHELTKGSYDLIFRPLFIYSQRTCIPFDFEMSIKDSSPAAAVAAGTNDEDAILDAADDECARGGFQAFPVTLNTPRFLGGSGQSHSTHFAGSYFTPSGDDKASLHFSLARTSRVRVAVTFNPFGGVVASSMKGKSGAGIMSHRFVLLHYPCMSKAPPYPYVSTPYLPKEYTCKPQVVWEDITKEFSRMVTIESGYYRLELSHTHHNGGGTSTTRDACMRFHMEMAIATSHASSSSSSSSSSRLAGGISNNALGGFAVEEKCPHEADHLPPHPPTHLAMSYSYDSQIRGERLAYQMTPKRRLTFMAPFVAEKPFRLIIEIGYDFLLGDLRIDLARHPDYSRPG